MMRKFILCTLVAILMVGVFSWNALAKDNVGVLFAGDAVALGPKLKGVPVELLEWNSTNESVATVSQGHIDGLSAGSAIITASYNDKSADCSVVVLPKALRVGVGELVALPNVSGMKYRVEDKGIAAVSRKGQVLGIEEGVTRLAVRCSKQKFVLQLIVTADGAAPDPEQSAAAQLDCADTAEQIVLVDYQNGSKASLSIHEKQDGIWKELYSCAAYVGRNGIDKAKEGDGKTPTGTYNLTQPFGIKADPGANMDYVKLTKYHYWCGTSGTKYYNRLVDEREVDRKHTSSDEYLIDYKGVYNYCMFIDYNASGEAGKGSCIFLHCKGSKNSTAGCIAVDEKVMKGIIRWVKPGCKIVIR